MHLDSAETETHPNSVVVDITMNLTTSEAITNYVVRRVDHYITQSCGLTPLTDQERADVIGQIPHELRNPYQTIYGNPSPISPMTLEAFTAGALIVGQQFMLQRQGLPIRPSHTLQLVCTPHGLSSSCSVLNEEVTTHKAEIRLDMSVPIESAFLIGMMRTYLDMYADNNLGDPVRWTTELRFILCKYVFTSPYVSSGKIQDIHKLYALFVEALYVRQCAAPRGLFGCYRFDFPKLVRVAELLYVDGYPGRYELATILDEKGINWRLIDDIEHYWKDPGDEVENILSIIQKAV